MEYDFPAWYYSSTFGGVQTFPPWEETCTQESRKQKQKHWPGASLPLPALPNVSKRWWQLSVLCWLVKWISKHQGSDAPRSSGVSKMMPEGEERRYWQSPGAATCETWEMMQEHRSPGAFEGALQKRWMLFTHP